MALQDNFNAIYNKKEQAKQQKEAEKSKNLIFEIELQELLQDYITEYLTEHNNIDILLSSTKRRIIARILRENTFAVEKCSKYKDVINIKTYLLLHYDKIAGKCLRIAKLFDKQIEQQKQAEFETEAEKIALETIAQQEQDKEQKEKELQAELKKEHQKEIWQNVAFGLLLIFLAPLAIMWGIISALSKK